METTIIDAEFTQSTEKKCNLKKKTSLLPKISKKKQKKLVKIGMASSLALTTVSGFVDSKYARKVHVASGLLLAGLCVWHAGLYKKNKKKDCA